MSLIHTYLIHSDPLSVPNNLLMADMEQIAFKVVFGLVEKSQLNLSELIQNLRHRRMCVAVQLQFDIKDVATE